MMEQEQRKVLNIGAQVQLTEVDRYGFWGRDPHPRPEDVGFLGFVTRIAEVYCGHPMENPQLAIGLPLREEDYVVYEVTSASGFSLHLVDHEIEVLR